MFIKTLVFLALAGFSSLSFANFYATSTDAYNACGSGCYLGSIQYDLSVCAGDGRYNYYNLPYAGSTQHKYCVSGRKPCASGQVHDLTGQCVSSVTICAFNQTPLTSNCTLPTSGVPVSCMDGSTVYVPAVCDAGFFDRYMTPPPGTSTTCDDGHVPDVGQSCFARYWDMILNNDGHAFDGVTFAFGTGTLPTITAIAPALAKNASQELVATFPLSSFRSSNPLVPITGPSTIAAKVDNFNVSSSVPNYPLGKAVENYLKSAPTSPYANSFKAAANDAGFPVTVNTNTGVVASQASGVPLSSNQLADFAKTFEIGIQPSVSHPIAVQPISIPLQQVAPFLEPTNFPWMLPGVEAIQADFKAVNNPFGAKSPVNFPNVTSPSFVTPLPNISTPPLASFTPQSPLTYVKPATIPTSSLPSPTVNQNPTGTDVQTSPASPPPTGPISPTATIDVPPVPPELFDDKFKYFDFLPTNNPFNWNAADFLPSMPSSACNYEIHQVVHVPFMGPHPFNLAPCVPLQPLRAVLAWAFAVLTAWLTFILLFKAEV